MSNRYRTSALYSRTQELTNETSVTEVARSSACSSEQSGKRTRDFLNLKVISPIIFVSTRQDNTKSFNEW
jgi:hypothetical protein